MGNYISCTLTTVAAGAHRQLTKVILPGGDVRHISSATAAAELMLDHPGNFLVHSRSMLIGRRLFALSADEELELGALYAMFPMDRLGTAAAPADMARLLLAAGKESRPTPAPPEAPTSEAEGAPGSCRFELDEMGGALIQEFRFKKSMCRSRRPVLETITEETVC
ncbi:hypothetical protein AXF42_Ash002262 [Apostasia shenzhenica]|uniref:DUF4228 domain-containing protein n=1 Tax=Apostasia shenzhenica TaxID=1088818 RepID=A0A2I0AN08_9ASPA|nr:hypothetical protein AXF42_Ash002262 [Apostasia shenzhenica]